MRRKINYKRSSFFEEEMKDILNILNLETEDSYNLFELCSIIHDWFYNRQELIYMRLNSDFSEDELRCGCILAGIIIYEKLDQELLERVSNSNISRIAKFILNYTSPHLPASRLLSVLPNLASPTFSHFVRA